MIGDEAFLPRNASTQAALFTLQEWQFGALKFEAGARYEHAVAQALPDLKQQQFSRLRRNFDTLSGALGAAAEVRPGWKIGINLSRTERAPAAEELFANGPHAGTEAFEIGDPELKAERAASVEAILRGNGSGYSLEASLYHTWFSNFVFDERTGAVEDGLPVYRIRQASARYYGFELQARATLADWAGIRFNADAMADWVHADIAAIGPAPRIPPLRMLGGLGVAAARWDLRGEVEHVTGQGRIARNETPTPAYTMVNLEMGWRPWGEDRPLSLVLTVSNLFDVEARRHASFLKDYAPLAGRDIRLTLWLEL